jgi:hypothetical protein
MRGLRIGLLAMVFLLGLGSIPAHAGSDCVAPAAKSLDCGVVAGSRSAEETTCPSLGLELSGIGCCCRDREPESGGPPCAAANRAPGSTAFDPPAAGPFWNTASISFPDRREPLILGRHGPPLFLQKSSLLM